MIPIGASRSAMGLNFSFRDQQLDLGTLAEEVEEFFNKTNAERRAQELPEFSDDPLLVFDYNQLTTDARDDIAVPLEIANYSLFVYLQAHQEVEGPVVATVSPISFFTTDDGYLILSRRSKNVHTPGKVGSSVGGTLELADVSRGRINLDGCVYRETKEEVGQQLADQITDLRPIGRYMYENLRCLGLGYEAKLNLNAGEALRLIREGAPIENDREFSGMYTVSLDQSSIEEFMQEHEDHLMPYMPGMIKLLTQE